MPTTTRDESVGPVMSHEDIAQELRRRILTVQYGPGQRIPPERELIEEFGCSRMTVAKAMAPLVADGLIERHPGRGTFVTKGQHKPGPAGPAGRSNGRAATRGNVIKYISPGQEESVRDSRNDVLSALHGVLDEAGYHVSIDLYGDLDEHLRCLAKVHDRQIAGVVLWPAPHARTRKAISELVRAAIPLVLVDTYLPDLDCDYVVTDNIEGAALMVRHLAQLGHRRICYLTPLPDRTSLRDRLTGFLRGLVEAELPVDDGSVARLPMLAPLGAVPPDSEALAGLLDRVMGAAVPPTALFTSNDTLALAILPLLHARGLSVPEDVTLVGYDGIEAGEFGAVPLTTIKQDFGDMATVAARILLERFDGRPAPLRYHRLIEPQLVVRASCAPPGARCAAAVAAV